MTTQMKNTITHMAQDLVGSGEFDAETLEKIIIYIAENTNNTITTVRNTLARRIKKSALTNRYFFVKKPTRATK